MSQKPTERLSVSSPASLNRPGAESAADLLTAEDLPLSGGSGAAPAYDLDLTRMDDEALVVLAEECAFPAAVNALAVRYFDWIKHRVALLGQGQALTEAEIQAAQEAALLALPEAITAYAHLQQPRACSFRLMLRMIILEHFRTFLENRKVQASHPESGHGRHQGHQLSPVSKRSHLEMAGPAYDLDLTRMEDEALVVLAAECAFPAAVNALAVRYFDWTKHLVTLLARGKHLPASAVREAQERAVLALPQAVADFDQRESEGGSFRSFLRQVVVAGFGSFLTSFRAARSRLLLSRQLPGRRRSAPGTRAAARRRPHFLELELLEERQLMSANPTLPGRAPVALADAYFLHAGRTFQAGGDSNTHPGVLANDTAPQGLSLTALLVSGPAHGVVNLNSDGSFTYISAPGFTGIDTFTYQANDGSATSNVVPVSLHVTDTPPAALADAYQVQAGSSLHAGAGGSSIAGVLANDIDVDEDALTAGLVSGPTHGSLALQNDGSFTYTPDLGFVGSDSFTYQASDGTLPSNVAAVTIHVTDTSPVANADSYTVHTGDTLTVGQGVGSPSTVLANDTDVEENPLTATLVSGPTHGTLTWNSSGAFTYNPDSDFAGLDSFTYQASDGTLTSSPAVVTLFVTPNTPPVAHADAYTVQAGASLQAGFGASQFPSVLANDTDAQENPLTATLVSGPAHGSLTLNNDGSFIYTPSQGFVGGDSFTYQARFRNLTSNVATVTLAVTDTPPQALADVYLVHANQALTTGSSPNSSPGVLANDVSLREAPLSATLVSAPAHGTLQLNQDGTFTYTPDSGFVGTDTFTYQAGDGTLTSAPATVTLNVSDNSAPVAADDAYKVPALTLANIMNALKNAPSSSKGSGWLNILLGFGPNWVTGWTQAVLTNPGLVTLPGMGFQSTSVLANDIDVAHDPLTVNLVQGPAHGSLTLNPQGSFSYVPQAGFTGTDTFSYQASDGLAVSNPATVTLRVVDTAPTTAADTSFTLLPNQTLTGQLGGEGGEDGNLLFTSQVAPPTHGTLSLQLDGSFTYTPAPNFVGQDSFQYEVYGGAGVSAPATVTLKV
ncbi:MAG: tandem-95 repeat protein, partial [Planctomycetes bacterium]|nr:tandem-95 repeat protein [Planctomycetota bacterium]